MDTKFLMVLVLALFLDGLDYLGGFLPLVGDLLDIFGIIILFPLIGKYALLGAAELIPTLDFLPLFTGSVIVWKMKGGES